MSSLCYDILNAVTWNVVTKWQDIFSGAKQTDSYVKSDDFEMTSLSDVILIVVTKWQNLWQQSDNIRHVVIREETGLAIVSVPESNL
jgi:hypothetical protein